MRTDSKLYRFFFGRGTGTALPLTAWLLVLVPFLLAALYWKGHKHNAIASNPVFTRTAVSKVYSIRNTSHINYYIYVGNRRYEGDCSNKGFVVGDSIGVVYQKDNPKNNMPVFEYYDRPSYGFVLAFVGIVIIMAVSRWRNINRLYIGRVAIDHSHFRACAIYKTPKEYIFLTGYGREGSGYNMSYPIMFAPIDCSDEEFNKAFGEVFMASNRDKYKELKSSELIKAMKQHSWRQFYLQSTTIFVMQEDAEIRVIPTQLASDGKHDWDYNRSLTFNLDRDSMYDIVSEARKLLDNKETD